ncbi:MAG TPA: EscF/YscF/HrpA family type III secretion system needle major subunit [Chthoniobacterales bacterium]|nr:EscF/YscF/HrpA family type III secretion system needle major subunit [Chthoniobacterales bacterium]
MGLPTNPNFFNPYNPADPNIVSGNSPLLQNPPFIVCTYGFNLNFIGAAMFPQIASTFNALQASLLNVDASNPAALLQVQLTMSEYENAVQATSQMYASFETLIKAIIQNL